MEQKKFKANAECRLDVYLQNNLEGKTRNFIQHLIEENNVLVNNKVVTKCGTKIKLGQEILVNIPAPKNIEAVAQDIPLEIVYEDADLLVINKPQGMVVHPANGNFTDTLVNALLFSVKDLSGINGKLRPGIVHRLDKDTSGLMLVAKNDFAHNSLAKQIAEKTCKREYLALLNGVVKKDCGTIETLIGRYLKDRKKMAVVPTNGKLAISDLVVEKRFSQFSLVRFKLKTSRTHQIRVHAKYMGHTVVADPVYGKPQMGLSGQLLHSCYIQFTQPTTGAVLEFSAPLPDYFAKVVEKLDI